MHIPFSGNRPFRLVVRIKRAAVATDKSGGTATGRFLLKMKYLCFFDPRTGLKHRPDGSWFLGLYNPLA